MKKLNNKYIKIAALILLLGAGFAAVSFFGKTVADEGVKEANAPLAVTAQTIKESDSLKENLEYSAIVSGDQEAKIFAKTSGNAKEVNFKVGDKVKMGALLVRIDEPGANVSGQGFNSAQVKQAQISASQAYASYEMARTNYQNTLNSSQKDLAQARIARDQARTGTGNTNLTIEESLKASQIAYDTAKEAAEQARLALENRKKISGQSEIDMNVNADTAVDTAADTCNSVITSINNITSLDDNNIISLSYKSQLGALDVSVISAAKKNYITAQTANQKYISTNFNGINSKISAALDLAQETKKLADSVKILLDKTVPTAELPQTSLTGSSLSSLQSAVSSYQSLANGAISQINGAKQSLTNTPLNNTAALDALQKAYDLAKKQEAQAAQSLNNLKAGNKSQIDSAGFGQKSAENQYEAAKIRLDSQISMAKSQMDISEFQYQNAVQGLQSLYDIHLATAAIDGTITQKFVNQGEAVSQGQLLAVVSQPEKVKLTFYTDQDNLPYFTLGQAAIIKDAQGNSYPGKVTSITPQADSLTKRFMIEVRPDQTDGQPGNKESNTFVLGTVMDIVVPITKKAKTAGTAILPLSAIEVGQSGNYIFYIEEAKAKKIKIEIVKVEGENAEVKIGLPEETLIVVDGNKLIHEGDPVTVKEK
ncbi:MAG: HlyD family efflux transporter periplasmic adaptor subunit [Patescibacteria group bacterium]|jgi:multidrug efflux pump subunit AcrA (membrane-fusion protein)